MIRLYVADDHPIVREGLKRIIADSSDMRVVGEAAHGTQVLAEVDNHVDVLLLDISMPGPGLLTLIRQLRGRLPNLRILVLSVQPEELYAVRALRAGAAGYLTKDQSPAELAGAIRRVHGGGRYVSAALAEVLAARVAETESLPHEALSNREYEVLALLGTGMSIKDIAERLSLSAKSISTYRARILEKTGLTNTAELIRYAVEHDIRP
jgi:two-component system, NarL family, invasion response regulator UvrY